MKKFICIVVGFIFLSFNAFAEEIEDADTEDVYMGGMALVGEFLDGNLLKISVVAGEMVQPVLGIAFNVNFDSEYLDFLKYEPGDFLERGGDPFYLVKNEESRVIFGETLRREDSFPVGGGIVAEFYFQILEEEVFDFSFYNGVVSTLDVVRQDIDKILWEDLILSRGDEEMLIDLDYSKSSILNTGGFELSKILPWLLVLIGGGGVFFVYFLSKKQEKKRP
ncbi:MAG: hypothetical protein GWP15_00730 [Nitrospirae bacterium]|nr:hypothetical protein [Nitrospirota bacterium]